MNDSVINRIKDAAQQCYPAIRDWRRDMHQHPELSFQEKRTASIITTLLDQLGIPYTTGWAGHGVVATIDGHLDGPTIMLRADMDALPIHEINEVPYKSIEEGVMHACGHDVHCASLLGAATILMQVIDQVRGKIILIFQPGEEKLPGGASLMIKEGLLEKYRPACIIAQHVFPSLPAGHVGFRGGLYMASADELYITIKGKGGHAATPHLAIDPILVAARVISALPEVVNRTKDPLIPGVLTIGKINSIGGATNVIPDEVRLEGTLRAMDETWRYQAHEHIRTVIGDITHASGASADIRIEIGYPCLINNESLTNRCQAAASGFLGETQVHDLPQRMTSEDFAFYSQHIPATFYRLGTGWEDRDNPPVHSNRFDINEEALKTGMGLLAYLALTITV